MLKLKLQFWLLYNRSVCDTMEADSPSIKAFY